MSIGLEIAVEKAHENDTDVEYAFFVREGRGGLALANPTARPGRAALSKLTGQVTLREACPDDVSNEVLFPRVAAVLQRHWRHGEFPAVTWWAA
jgi:hypothetical protein